MGSASFLTAAVKFSAVINSLSEVIFCTSCAGFAAGYSFPIAGRGN